MPEFPQNPLVEQHITVLDERRRDSERRIQLSVTRMHQFEWIIINNGNALTVVMDEATARRMRDGLTTFLEQIEGDNG